MINLGVIGMSEGNGHPFSWSSIINGYSPAYLSQCGFPSIYDYMMENQHPTTCFDEAKVTCVLSQRRSISEKISACANIPLIVDDTVQLVEQVDAVLLARDDAENHMSYAKDALVKGIPIFIDKPVSLTVDQLDQLYNAAKDKRMIYSCSALRFADEILLDKIERKKIGELKEINCNTPKSWDKYAVHLIDPLFHIMEGADYSDAILLASDQFRKKIKVFWSNGISSTIEASEKFESPIHFTYVGSHGQITKNFTDSYSAFKKSLLRFTENINNNQYFDEYEKLKKIVGLIEIGSSS